MFWFYNDQATKDATTQELQDYNDYNKGLMDLYRKVLKNKNFFSEANQKIIIDATSKGASLIAVHKDTYEIVAFNDLVDNFDAMIMMSESYHLFRNGCYYNRIIDAPKRTPFEEYIREQFHLDFDVLVKYAGIKFYSPDEYLTFVGATKKAEFPLLVSILSDDIENYKKTSPNGAYNVLFAKWREAINNNSLPFTIDSANALAINSIYPENVLCLNRHTNNLFRLSDIVIPALPDEYYKKEYTFIHAKTPTFIEAWIEYICDLISPLMVNK